MGITCPHCGKQFEKKPQKRRNFEVKERDPMKKVAKILNFLKAQTEWVWIRRIAKQINIKPFSVSYLIDKYLSVYLDILDPTDVYENTGIKMRLYRLKNREIDPKAIIMDIKLRKKK